jgi:hypothetical protein
MARQVNERKGALKALALERAIPASSSEFSARTRALIEGVAAVSSRADDYLRLRLLLRLDQPVGSRGRRERRRRGA